MVLDISTALADMSFAHGSVPFLGEWRDKHQWNTPGPLYAGSADRSGNGPCLAPNNVIVGDEGYDVIFRQPVNRYELHQLVQAASADCFMSYGADGNKYWTLTLVRYWWLQRHDLIRKLDRLYTEQLALVHRRDPIFFSGISRWRNYLSEEEDLAQYLRTYAFFLEEGRLPQANEQLPTI